MFPLRRDQSRLFSRGVLFASRELESVQLSPRHTVSWFQISVNLSMTLYIVQPLDNIQHDGAHMLNSNLSRSFVGRVKQDFEIGILAFELRIIIVINKPLQIEIT